MKSWPLAASAHFPNVFQPLAPLEDAPGLKSPFRGDTAYPAAKNTMMPTTSLPRISLPLFTLMVAACVGIGYFATPYMGAATLAYSLMVAGIYFRLRAKHLHRALMFSAMGIDLCLVLLLEFQRDAIGTVIALDMGILPLAHVVCSTAALLLYPFLIYLGRNLWSIPSPKTRRKHRLLGITAFALRSLGFVLMFSLLWGKSGP